MSLFSKIGEKLGEKVLGSVVPDFGTLPADKGGWTVSITLRKRAAGGHHLAFKWKRGSHTSWETLEASPEALDKLEAIVQESRRQINR